MNWKKIFALALFLAALVVVIAFVNRKEKGRLAVEGTLLDIPATSIDKIELRNHAGLFVFSSRDTLWYLEKPLAAKADKVVLEGILDNFSQLKYDRLVAEDGRNLKTFGLDKPEIELKLFVGGRPAAAIALGMKNSLDDSSYAKLAAGAKVVTLAAYKRNDLEKDLFAFRDKKFFAIDTMTVTSLNYRYGDNSFVLVKKDDRWFMEKPVYSLAREAKVSDILSSASLLEAVSFDSVPGTGARGAFGLEKPLLTAEFHSASGMRRIEVGQKGERYYALTDGAAEICGINKDFLEKFSGEATAFREKKVALFYAYDVHELFFRQGPFQFTVRKDAAGTWDFSRPVPGKKPVEEKINGLLTALADLEAEEFIDTPKALPAVTTRVVLKTEDQADPGKQSEIVIEFGVVAGETVIARNPVLSYGFKVGKGILEKFPGKIEDISGETDTAAPKAGK